MTDLNFNNQTNASKSSTNCFDTFAIHEASNPSIIMSAITTSALSAPIGLLAIVGNSVFLYIMFRVRRLRTAYNYLLVFLALTDLCLGLLSVPVFIFRGVLRSFHLSSCYLREAARPKTLLVGLSLVGILVLTLDRLFAVMYPLKRKLWSLKKIYAVLYVVMFCVILGLSILRKMKIVNFDTSRLVIGAVVFLILVLVTVSYIKIYRVIKASEKVREELAPQITSKKKKSIFTSGFITLLVVLLYFPRIFVAMIEGEEALFIYSRWTELMLFSNSAINPMIYFYRKEDVKIELCRIFRKARVGDTNGTNA